MQCISISQWTLGWTVTMGPHDYLHESFQLHFMCFYPLLSLLLATLTSPAGESPKDNQRNPEVWEQTRKLGTDKVIPQTNLGAGIQLRPPVQSLYWVAGNAFVVVWEGCVSVLYLKRQWVGGIGRNCCCRRTEPSVGQDLLGRIVQDLRRRCSAEGNLGQRYLLSTQDNNISVQCRGGWSRSCS